MSALELTGLKGHNPLGFLAASGLLRVASDKIEMLLGWKPTGSNDGAFTACVHTSCVETEDQLRERLIEIVADSAVSYLRCLDEHGLTEAEALLDDYRRNGGQIIGNAGPSNSSARAAAALLSAIGSDLTIRQKASGKKKGKTVVKNSDLLMTSGQQDLLKAKGRKPAAKLAKRSRAGDIPSTVREKIRETLFGPWRYEDDDHPLGLDPQLQRLHALRNKAPTKDNKRRSVFAAVFLASQALPLFPCFAIGSQLRTTGFRRDIGKDWFAWPIWRKPISLDTLRSLLAQPFSNDLKHRGVEVVYRCCRVHSGGSKGDYRVFSHSEQWPWPLRPRRGRGGIGSRSRT